LSSILKALRRLEEEKASDVQRPLEAAVAEPVRPPSAGRGRLRTVVAVVAAAALGAGAVWWLQAPAAGPSAARSPAPAVPGAAPDGTETAPRAPGRAGAEGVAERSSAAREGPRDGAPVAMRSPEARPPGLLDTPPVRQEPPLGARSPVASARPAPEPPAAPRVRPAPTPAVAAAPPTARTSPAPPVAAEPPAPPPVATAPPVRIARAEPPPAAPAPVLPPPTERPSETGVVVGAPPGAAADGVGEDVRPAEPPRRDAARTPAPPGIDVHVVRTVWHPRPERRTALLETPEHETPRLYREGDAVGAAQVVRIEPSGVVFERDGRELRREVGRR